MTEEEFHNTVIPLRSKQMSYTEHLAASTDDAEELTQKTMLRLWDMRTRF